MTRAGGRAGDGLTSGPTDVTTLHKRMYENAHQTHHVAGWSSSKPTCKTFITIAGRQTTFKQQGFLMRSADVPSEFNLLKHFYSIKPTCFETEVYITLYFFITVKFCISLCIARYMAQSTRCLSSYFSRNFCTGQNTQQSTLNDNRTVLLNCNCASMHQNRFSAICNF